MTSIKVTKASTPDLKLADLQVGEYATITTGEYAGYNVLRLTDRVVILASGGCLTFNLNVGCERMERGDVLTITF